MQDTQKRGFNSIEFIVVVSILALLTGVVAPRIGDQLEASRDAARLAHMQRIAAAVEQYHHDRGAFPRPDASSKHGGWDVSHDGGFLTQLVENGYLEQTIVDPVNDEAHHYRYFVYAEGDQACRGQGPFFVLGLTAFENRDFARRHKGFFRCGSRNWGREFAYVTGGGAAFQP